MVSVLVLRPSRQPPDRQQNVVERLPSNTKLKLTRQSQATSNTDTTKTPSSNNNNNNNNNNSNTHNDARFSQATTLNQDGTINSKYANKHNVRASTLYTSQPFVLPPNSSVQSLAPEHPKSVDIQSWTGALSRLQDSRFERQRYVMSAGKNDEVSKLALGAKVERALGRRFVGQDAEGPAHGAGNGSEKEKVVEV